MTKLSSLERETVILFNEAESSAEIEAHNKTMKRRLEALRQKYPNEIILVRSDNYASVYTFPKKWLKIIPQRRVTEKQRKHLAKARIRTES